MGRYFGCHGNKNINILSFFIHGICKSDIGYFGTIYISFIYTFAVKRYLDLKMVNFKCSENWFLW